MSDIWFDIKMLLKHFVFTSMMIFLLLLNTVLLPLHIIIWCCRRNIYPIIWPHFMKERFDMYKKHYGDAVERFIYKDDNDK